MSTATAYASKQGIRCGAISTAVFHRNFLIETHPQGIPRLFPECIQNHRRCRGDILAGIRASCLPLFTWAGIPWACNPVISALTLIVVHRLALAVFNDHEAAGIALLLTVASPVIFADGISYYSMPAHLLANSLYALLLIQPTPRRAFAAGVVGAIALSLHNPVPHVLFAAPWLMSIAARPDRVRC